MNYTFVKIRRSVLEHIEKRRLSLTEYAVLLTLTILADKANGTWHGCSLALSAKFGDGSLSKNTARDVLRSLESGGHIKRFRTPGQRGNYPILVNGYEATVGALKGQLINASATEDWRNPVCCATTDSGSDDGSDNVSDNVTLSRPQYHKTSIPSRMQDQSPTSCNEVGDSKKNRSAVGEIKRSIPKRPQSMTVVKVQPLPHGPELTAEQWRTSAPDFSAAATAIVTFEDGNRGVAAIQWEDGVCKFVRQGRTLVV